LVGYLQQMCSDSSIATRYLLATECALCYSIASIRAIALDLLNILLERISTIRDLIHLNTTPLTSNINTARFRDMQQRTSTTSTTCHS
jgi:hypothetical protein